jgi:hypothetical protein
LGIVSNLYSEQEHITVLTAPCNKPFVVTKEQAEKMGLLKPKRRLTSEERAEIKRKADQLFRKPTKG